MFWQKLSCSYCKGLSSLAYYASEPGGSNDSVYLRLRYLEKLYGAPDKVIVQWTHLTRTTVVTDEFIPRDFKHNTVENYTYCKQSDINFLPYQ